MARPVVVQLEFLAGSSLQGGRNFLNRATTARPCNESPLLKSVFMKIPGWAISLLAVLSMVVPFAAQQSHKFMTGSAAKSGDSADLQVAPDLDQRLDKFREVHMPFHSEGLTAREKELVEK